MTLKKIADKLGLSIGTVSKALKDYPDISENTKKRVLTLAEELHYRPNSFAQSLRNNESKVVGLIIPEITHDFFAKVIHGVVDAAKENGYVIILLQSDDFYENEKEQLDLLLDKNVDGILISLSNTTTNVNHIKEVIDRGIPVVLYDKIFKLLDCSKVIVNDRKAAYNATSHLIRGGCKKIAHIRGNLDPQTTIDRFLGYKAAIEDSDLEYDESLVYTIDGLSFENGYQVAEQMMKDHKDIDGVFAFTDIIAAGVLMRLKELQIAIPSQVSIVGFSNWFLTNVTTPKLTTVDQPGYEMGRKAFELLLKEMKAKKEMISHTKEIVELSTNLIIRDSTKVV
ncbi:MAG: substrate-binding domain-containing protein [Flavobacteriaceae bacterium]|nr:MAG: substrate-binding domain-containing protein [Flavobacteriaceae bacterium]